MANSKSNIYPIQLQGAELNLNKLDAEIKQYSGFNKNNSPFVGGCLSNVFHKEKQISGGNADNTYIDTNGDVYNVTRSGLYKNGEQIIKTEGVDFYKIEELEGLLPEGTVFLYDEDIYIYRSYEKYYLSYKNTEYNLLEDFSSLGLTDLTLNSPIFNIYIRTFNNEEFVFIAASGRNKEYILVYKNNNGELIPTSYILDSNIKNLRCPVLKFDTTLSKVAFLTPVSLSILGYVFDFSSGVLSNKTNILYTNLTGKNIDDPCYYFTDNKCYYIPDSFEEDIDVSGNKIGVKYNYTINFSTASISLTDGDGPLKSSLTTVDTIASQNIILKPWGAAYALKLIDPSEVTHNCSITVSSIVTSFATVTDLGCYNNIGGIINDCVLINNSLASGICLPSGYVLATEWNSVDLDYIFFGDNTPEWKENKFVCLWKDINNNKWYKLVKSAPILKYFNGQIFINADTIFNSYRLIDGKKLLFAPAWNNRAYEINNFGFANNKSNYFASAINEYNLDDNASIILNPIPVECEDSPGRIFFDATNEILNDFIIINFYIGSTSVIQYRSSIALTTQVENNIITVLSRKLIISSKAGLTFPSNTDGNVLYSLPLFFSFFSSFGNDIFIKIGNSSYQIAKYNGLSIMSFYLGTLVENLESVFILQGQYYGIINKQIFSLQFNNGVVADMVSIVSVENLQFVGNTPYEALFFSKTNRCLYSFTGANVLNQKQLVDKISEVRNYLYNPATQTVFLITDIGVLFYGLFGMFLLEYTDITNIFLLDNGIVMSDNSGNYRYIKYYLDEGDEGYTKENIRLETCFYGMNNEVVTINDCLYFRLFSEEHEEGQLKVSATTISLSGRKTEETTFKIKASDWDKITHTIYLRYQPKAQRGLGVSFSIDSPFKIASMSVGSQPDAVLVDKVSKGAITAPSVTTNNDEW